MAGTRPYSELRARMSPEARRQSELESLRIIEEIGLAEYNRLLKLSQEELARPVNVEQGVASKVE